jgi:CMP-N-acetylneuraminic acid synthetase
MIRSDFLRAVGGYDETYTCQDGYELWVKFINKFKVTNINKTLFSYRRHNNNLTNNENRILGTRLKIKDAYVQKHKLKLPDTVAIIPLRPHYDLVLEEFGDSTFLDYKIIHLLEAKNISKVIVTSSDIAIEDHIKRKYKKEVRFVKRPEKLERINVSLFKTLEFLNQNEELNGIEACLFCSVSYPFVDSQIINDAINTLAIFKADSLVSVRPEGNKFYRHTGDGMQAILQQDQFTKLEREALYKYTGGIILTHKASSIKSGKLIYGNVGHIVVGEKAALNVDSNFEKQICHNLLTKSEFEKTI